MKTAINEYRSYYDKIRTEQDLLLKQKDDLEIKIENLEYRMDLYRKAKQVLSEVLRQTQVFFKKEVETLTTLFLQAIYGNKYKFIIDFVIKRNKFECQLMVQEGDYEPYVPKESTGGGVLDTISTALKIVMWSLHKPALRNTIILDEPAKFLGMLQKLFIQILKELSVKLNLQFIIVTHDDSIIEEADRVFIVTQEKGISKVECRSV